MAEMVRDAKMVVQGQICGVLFVKPEMPVDAEACAEKEREAGV